MSNAHGSYWIRPEKRLAIYARDGFACIYCGSDDKLSLDHLQPRELGGSNDASNLVTACVPCNSARQEFSLRRWFQMLRDRGTDTTKLSYRIRKHTARKLDLDLGCKLFLARIASSAV